MTTDNHRVFLAAIVATVLLILFAATMWGFDFDSPTMPSESRGGSAIRNEVPR